MKDAPPSASKSTPFQTALLIICVVGTAALVVGAVLFSFYYSANKSKLLMCDINYQLESPAGPKPFLEEYSFEEATLLTAGFEWGGCRAQNHDNMKGTFQLHCWGLARDPGATLAEAEAMKNRPPIPAPRTKRDALAVTSISKENIADSKKLLILLSAFCHDKLHLGAFTAKE